MQLMVFRNKDIKGAFKNYHSGETTAPQEQLMFARYTDL